MKIKSIRNTSAWDFDENVNSFLEKSENNDYYIHKIMYHITEDVWKCLIHYYTKEELRKNKIKRLLEPIVTINGEEQNHAS